MLFLNLTVELKIRNQVLALKLCLLIDFEKQNQNLPLVLTFEQRESYHNAFPVNKDFSLVWEPNTRAVVF